ncbi:hypothetical protein ACIA8E_39600, partial [Streptomyces sp. NPDC051664]|uniref:hypothetical protein n=1 Tax=Streptomyces sp. NPDC051664 TaxID=3365668 RepID=UPI0037B0A825
GDISTPHPSGDLPSLGNLPSLGGGGAGGGQGGGNISVKNPNDKITTTNPTDSGYSIPPVPTVSGLHISDGNGTVTTHHPSGGVSAIDPKGFTTTSYPDGSSTIAGPNGEFQTVPSPANMAGISTQATAQTGEANAMPAGAMQPAAAGQDAGGLSNLLSPLMMMMGMSRSGGQSQSGSERTRDLYQSGEGDGAFISGSVAQPAPRSDDPFEEEDEDTYELSPRNTVGGQGPPGMPSPSHAATQTTDWAEQEDVWGTGDEGLPASIGR